MSDLILSIFGILLGAIAIIFAVQYWAEIKEGVQTVVDLLQKNKIAQ